MIQLFSKNSLTLLESLSFTKTLYAFDFDGTLAKISKNRTEVTLSKTTELLLKELSTLVSVAIISGRSIEDLQKRLAFTPQYLIGNHGLEVLQESNKNSDVKLIADKWLQSLNSLNMNSGVDIENKKYSIALHYRNSKNKKQTKKEIASAIESLDPAPQVIMGKFVFNLLPPGGRNKGTAMRDTIKKSGATHAFYIGDDVTDEDIFQMNLPSGQLMAVRVGQSNKSVAQFYIERQSEIDQVLRLLIDYQKRSS